MIITISGLPGSGKSSVGKILAEKLGYKFYSIGDLRGKMAMERGLSIGELNKLGEKEEWTDKEADDYQKKLGEKEDNFVIDGRLSFHFIPHSVKILLTVDPGTGAERIFRDQRPDESADTLEEMIALNRERIESDRKRYRKYYGIDCFDEKHYDLVIDTTHLKKEQVIQKIMDFLKEKE